MKLFHRLGRALSFALTGVLVSGISFAAVTNWSTTSALNVESTGVSGTGGGVGIQGSSPASNIDDAMRDFMSQIATWRTTGVIGAFFGQTVIGHTAALSINGNSDNLQVIGTTAATGRAALAMFSATTTAAGGLDFYKSANASAGSATVVASGDRLGNINFIGAQQTGTFATQNAAAQIRSEVDGTVTSGASADMPGRLLFLTTPDGSGTPTERLRIDAAGAVTIAAGGALVMPQAASPAPTTEGDARWDTDENVFRVGNASTATQIGVAQGTSQASSSGNTISFTGIPAGTKRITVSFANVGTNGTALISLQLGDAGGIETNNYANTHTMLTTGANAQSVDTSAFTLGTRANAADTHSGLAVLTLVDAATFTWALEGSFHRGNTQGQGVVAGFKSLSAELTQLAIVTTDTYDGGVINIQYE